MTGKGPLREEQDEQMALGNKGAGRVYEGSQESFPLSTEALVSLYEHVLSVLENSWKVPVSSKSTQPPFFFSGQLFRCVSRGCWRDIVRRDFVSLQPG